MYDYFSTQRRLQATGNENFFLPFLIKGLGVGDVNVPVNLLTSCMLSELRGWLGYKYITIYIYIYVCIHVQLH